MNLEKVRKEVKSEEHIDIWNYHIVIVIKYAKQLADIFKIDKELVELAALLHDIGTIKVGRENHEITGQKEAKKILEKLNYDKKIVDEVIHCIATHRGDLNNPPKTMIAKIVANADAMAHFDVIPRFFYWKTKAGENFKDIIQYVEDKVERDWNNKITLPEARDIVREKYKAIKLILEANKKYIK